MDCTENKKIRGDTDTQMNFCLEMIGGHTDNKVIRYLAATGGGHTDS
jgi:hypothetical protein